MSAKRANRLTLGLGIVLAAILLLRLMVYVIPEGKVGVILTFGRPSSEAPVEPGPGIKWPWPIQQVRAVDARLRTLQAPFSEVLTHDNSSVLVGSFLLWRVTSPQRFLELGSDAAAWQPREVAPDDRSATTPDYSAGPLAGLRVVDQHIPVIQRG